MVAKNKNTKELKWIFKVGVFSVVSKEKCVSGPKRRERRRHSRSSRSFMRRDWRETLAEPSLAEKFRGQSHASDVWGTNLMMSYITMYDIIRLQTRSIVLKDENWRLGLTKRCCWLHYGTCRIQCFWSLTHIREYCVCCISLDPLLFIYVLCVPQLHRRATLNRCSGSPSSQTQPALCAQEEILAYVFYFAIKGSQFFFWKWKMSGAINELMPTFHLFSLTPYLHP